MQIYVVRWMQYSIFGCAVALGVCAPNSGAMAQENTDAPSGVKALIEHSEDPSVLILKFDQKIDMIAEPKPTPLLRLYGDGKVLVHFPVYMKRAGNYEMQLSKQEVKSLLSSLEQKGVMKFDAAACKTLMRQAAQARLQEAIAKGELETPIHASDDSLTVMEIHLVKYKPAGVNMATSQNVTKKISWHGLRNNAKQNPEVSELKDLAAAQKELLALTEHENLKAVND